MARGANERTNGTVSVELDTCHDAISLVTHVFCFCVSISLHRRPFEKRPKNAGNGSVSARNTPSTPSKVKSRSGRSHEERGARGGGRIKKIKADSSESASTGLLGSLKGLLLLPCIHILVRDPCVCTSYMILYSYLLVLLVRLPRACPPSDLGWHWCRCWCRCP